MPRAKKESVPISARIEKRTFERLEKFCEDSGLGKTVTLERALNMYMDEYYGSHYIVLNHIKQGRGE